MSTCCVCHVCILYFIFLITFHPFMSKQFYYASFKYFLKNSITTVRDSPDLKIVDPDSQEPGPRMYTIGLGLKKNQKTKKENLIPNGT